MLTAAMKYNYSYVASLAYSYRLFDIEYFDLDAIACRVFLICEILIDLIARPGYDTIGTIHLSEAKLLIVEIAIVYHSEQ
jgi:hypothetical protein